MIQYSLKIELFDSAFTLVMHKEINFTTLHLEVQSINVKSADHYIQTLQKTVPVSKKTRKARIIQSLFDCQIQLRAKENAANLEFTAHW